MFMDETVLIIMEKDGGVLTREAAVCRVAENAQLIVGAFAVRTEDGYVAHITLNAGVLDVDDEQFNEIFDSYDENALLSLGFVESLAESEDCRDPEWIITVPFTDSPDGIAELEHRLSVILSTHKNGLEL